MPARSSVLILLVGIGCAIAAEPKARPRLSSVVAEEKKSEASREVQPVLELGFTPGFRSFGDYLQAEARRPVGLEAFRETPPTPSASAGAGKTGQASKDSLSTPLQADSGEAEILVIPKVEVTAERVTRLEAKLAAMEANQSWEERSAETWEAGSVLGAILNPSFLKLGGYSGSGRAAVARRRVEMLRWVSVLTISLEEAKTPADKARIQADIDIIKDITRHWE
jgi:hypothetical protein